MCTLLFATPWTKETHQLFNPIIMHNLCELSGQTFAKHNDLIKIYRCTIQLQLCTGLLCSLFNNRNNTIKSI